MAIPIPPTYVYPPDSHQPYTDYTGRQPENQTMESAIDQFFGDSGNKTKDKKKKTGNKDGSTETKKRLPVETRYEAYTLQRLSPRAGDAKTWSRVGKLKSPFDSAKVYKDAVNHRTRAGMDASKMYDSLLINQQGVIDRLLEEKRRSEKNSDAVWTLFDVYKVKQDTPVGLFRTTRETLKLVVTIRCQDKSKSSYADKPPGSTAHPDKFVGEIIDLSQPMKKANKDDIDGDGKVGKKGKKNNNKNNNHNSDDSDEIVDVVHGDPFHLVGDHNHGGNNAVHHDSHYPQGQTHDQYAGWGNGQQNGAHDYHGQDNYGYNNQHQQQGQWQQNAGQYGNGYQQGYQGYQNQTIPPQAPMAPNPLDNPFMPRVGVPEQYMQPIADHAYNDYSARRPSRSRSRNRSRQPSRRRSTSYHPRRYQTPSLGSSHDDDSYGDRQFSPPPTPDSFDDRRRGYGRQVYRREGRTLYPDEQYVIMPAVNVRESKPLAIRTRTRPVVVVDDYPAARGRAIADYPHEVFEDADFGRRGHGREGVDFLRDPIVGRQSRYDDGYRSGRRW